MSQPGSPSQQNEAHQSASEALAWLRAEQGSQGASVPKPALLHELAIAEERTGDEMAAARDFLAAFNAEPQFREPLEALVQLLARRKSFKNLGKLLDALARAADTPEERARALCERAAVLIEHAKDDAEARTALEEATGERPEDPIAWLELEILAGRTGDQELRARALEARAALTLDATWRGLLLVGAADVEARRGEIDAAIRLLDAASEPEGAARFRARVVLEALARREGRDDVLARALESKAELVLEAIADAEQGDRLGVPRFVRQSEFAADAWLRAADARRRQGDPAGAAALLDRARERLPAEVAIAWARLAAAEAAGDTATAATIARALLDTGIAGTSGASLWLRIAEAAANAEDGARALEALGKALELDPGCVPARALQLDLLGGGQDPAAFAGALEAAGESLPSDAAKARAYLLAAYAYAVQARDVTGAKAALSQAAMLGVPPGAIARAARVFALFVDDGAWYEEATRRLTAAGANESEHAGLWFELARSRLLRRDGEGASRALEALAGAPGGEWLGRALAAYALRIDGEGAATPSANALDALAKAESEPRVARALTIAAAARADAAGDVEGAKTRLRELCEANATDEVAAVFLADLERRTGRTAEALETLARAAAAIDDAELEVALRVEAGIVAFRAGDRTRGVAELEAAQSGSRSTASLLAWALRGVDPDDAAARRRTLELAAEAGGEAGPLALERFALEAFDAQGDGEQAREALDALEGNASDDLLVAAALARLAWDGADRAAVERALDRLEGLSTHAAALAASERSRLARADGDRAAAERAAYTWAQAEGTIAPAIEWLGAAIAADEWASEISARRAIAGWLEGEARASVAASAAMVQLIHAPAEPVPLVEAPFAAARLANLDLAPLGADPRRRADALGGVGDALGDEARIDALLLSGFNRLAAGDPTGALEAFATVTEARPDELWGWEGVRSAAELLDDPERLAIACAQLGELSADDERGAMFWERAALVLLDRLKEPEKGELALEQAFARDPKRSVAFDRLFRRVRERKEDDKLLAITARRIDVADDPPELAKLFWEQARVLRQKGNRDAALAALENVTMIEPDHVGALALSGEIYITKGMYAEAARNLARLAELGEAPEKQRLMSGIAAVDLYENKLGDSMRALEVLVALHAAGLSTLPVRERLARAAAKTEAWSHATAILEELMQERPTREGRIEAARLAMAIWRDKIGDPARAERAAAKLLSEAPDDGEALDLALSGKLDAALSRRLFGSAREALVAALAKEPIDADRITRLAKIAGALSDLPLRQASLGALVAVGRAEGNVEKELAELDARVAKVPQVSVDEATIAVIGDPADQGPIARLFSTIAEHVAEALGPSLQGLGVGKKERIDPRAGLPIRNEIAAWAGALGLGEFEVYVGGPDPDGVQGIAAEVPALVVGAGVKAPLSSRHRQAIARELFALRRGIGVVRTRDETTVAAIVVAACNLAEVPIQAPPYAMLGEVQRQLGKALSRKTKKVLPDLCRDVVATGQDPKAWSRAALASMYRMAAIAAGDVSLVLSDALGKPRGELAPLVSRDDRARRLIGFVLSPHYLELRRRLGMGVT